MVYKFTCFKSILRQQIAAILMYRAFIVVVAVSEAAAAAIDSVLVCFFLPHRL